MLYALGDNKKEQMLLALTYSFHSSSVKSTKSLSSLVLKIIISPYRSATTYQVVKCMGRGLNRRFARAAGAEDEIRLFPGSQSYFGFSPSSLLMGSGSWCGFFIFLNLSLRSLSCGRATACQGGDWQIQNVTPGCNAEETRTFISSKFATISVASKASYCPMNVIGAPIAFFSHPRDMSNFCSSTEPSCCAGDRGVRFLGEGLDVGISS
jgi:hypothetical protein